MPTKVRSYSKINLGLAIGGPRPDGFHALSTLYQTLALHDFVTVAAHPVRTETRISIRSNDPRVPTDSRNTVWKMVAAALAAAGVTAEVTVEIEKKLPIQGGMGAGSANAAAALLGLERELDLTLAPGTRMQVAAGVGSDVPLFLVGGSVLGSDRGQVVTPVEAVRLGGSDEVPCVIALPRIGVSTPAAFREWDQRWQQTQAGRQQARADGLQNAQIRDTIEELSRTYALCTSQEQQYSASGIFPHSGHQAASQPNDRPENLQGSPREQLHGASYVEGRVEAENDLAGNSLLALVRTGIENDFETVVFPQYPPLREIKRHLMGTPRLSGEAKGSEPGSAVYAALSGSGSALFGLYRSDESAKAAQQRLQQHGVEAIVTRTIARPLYWSRMFAE